jgi:serine/threonine protein kinase
MSRVHDSASDHGPSVSNQVLEIGARFEDAWRGGGPPAIADYLPPGGPERLAVLVHLVHVDLERRLKAGEPVRVASYLVRYPELADDAGVVVDLLAAEYQLRRRQDPALSADEYLRRFPRYREALLARLSMPASSGVQAARPAAGGDQAEAPRAIPVAQLLPDDLAPRSPASARPTGAVDAGERREPTVLEARSVSSQEVQPISLSPAAESSQPTGMEPQTLPPRQGASAEPVAGPMRSLGDYEVLAELGRGGMGVVYKARQISLNRLVALKMILDAEHAGPDMLARFRTEAEAVARLQHPNIIQIHEVGEDNGRPFFALEYIVGASLANRLAGTPLPPREAAQLVETLARAMQAAHERDIVHRDLKPANVLLAGAPDTPIGQCTPKITDFGLAKKLGDTAGQTASGAIMGTPSYMAPEQAGGQSKQVGPAADVYALGAILYELLTGRPPFKAATAMDTLLQVLSEEPVPPSRLQPRLARDLETICLKCLEKHGRKRYGSAVALADDLRRFLVGEPIVARRVGQLERVSKWAKRRPALAGLLAVSVLADGQCLASGSGGSDLHFKDLPGEVMIWNAMKGPEVRTLKGHGFQGHCFAG